MIILKDVTQALKDKYMLYLVVNFKSLNMCATFHTSWIPREGGKDLLKKGK